jgi:hypothetical protein
VTAPSPSRSRRIGLWALLAVGLVAVAAIGSQPDPDVPFDPDGTGPNGLGGLRLLLEELGTDVELTTEPNGSSDIVAVLADGLILSDAQLDALERHLDRGGTVVVTDPLSELTPVVTSDFTFGGFESSEPLGPGDCDIEALDDLDRIEVFQSALYTTEGAVGSCYGRDGQAFVTVHAAGEDDEGTLVSVGGTRPFTNELLGDRDNAALAAALLAPSDGGRVSWITADTEGTPTDSLTDLVSPSIRQGLVQLLLAFVVLALARGRRLGAPLDEPLPTPIAGSELVVAVGDLLQRTRSPGAAAELLRRDARRVLCERLGLAPGADVELVADRVAGISSIEREAVVEALAATTVVSDEELLEVATRIETIRREVLHGERT